MTHFARIVLGNVNTAVDGSAAGSRPLINPLVLRTFSRSSTEELRRFLTSAAGESGGRASEGILDPDVRARCECMVNQVPGATDDPATLAAGIALCGQDPANFETQLRAASIDLAACGQAQQFYQTTAGKVAIGAGVVALLGAAWWAFK